MTLARRFRARSQIRSFHSSRRDAPAASNLGHGAARRTLFSIPRFPRESLTTVVRLPTRAFVSITTTIYPDARSFLRAHACGNARAHTRHAGAGRLTRAIPTVWNESMDELRLQCRVATTNCFALASLFVSERRERVAARREWGNRTSIQLL